MLSRFRFWKAKLAGDGRYTLLNLDQILYIELDILGDGKEDPSAIATIWFAERMFQIVEWTEDLRRMCEASEKQRWMGIG